MYKYEVNKKTMQHARASKKIPFPGNMTHEKVKNLLKGHMGYVLVTCSSPNKKGKMEVEVSYEGDVDLASYLVQGAAGYMENEQENGL